MTLDEFLVHVNEKKPLIGGSEIPRVYGKDESRSKKDYNRTEYKLS